MQVDMCRVARALFAGFTSDAGLEHLGQGAITREVFKHVMFPPIGFKRIIFRSIFQRALNPKP